MFVCLTIVYLCMCFIKKSIQKCIQKVDINRWLTAELVVYSRSQTKWLMNIQFNPDILSLLPMRITRWLMGEFTLHCHKIQSKNIIICFKNKNRILHLQSDWLAHSWTIVSSLKRCKSAVHNSLFDMFYCTEHKMRPRRQQTVVSSWPTVPHKLSKCHTTWV